MTWVSSNGVGGMIPVVGPIVRRSVLITFRFPLACFTAREELEVREIVLRTNGRRGERRYVFDDVEIVEGLA